MNNPVYFCQFYVLRAPWWFHKTYLPPSITDTIATGSCDAGFKMFSNNIYPHLPSLVKTDNTYSHYTKTHVSSCADRNWIDIYRR
jgi:hypothetical protein